MPQHNADRGPDGATGEHADESAERFSDPLHTLIY
jgi:hypothetical protein